MLHPRDDRRRSRSGERRKRSVSGGRRKRSRSVSGERRRRWFFGGGGDDLLEEEEMIFCRRRRWTFRGGGDDFLEDEEINFWRRRKNFCCSQPTKLLHTILQSCVEVSENKLLLEHTSCWKVELRPKTWSLNIIWLLACRFRRKDMILQRNVLSVFPQGERSQRLYLVLRLGKSQAATAECWRCSLHLCTTNSLLQLIPGYLVFESRLLTLWIPFFKTNLLE